MANIKQQKKRAKTDLKKFMAARSYRRKIRTFIVKTEQAIDSSSKSVLQLLNETKKFLDKSANKNIKKANFVKRQKSRLEKRFNESLKKK